VRVCVCDDTRVRLHCGRTGGRVLVMMASAEIIAEVRRATAVSTHETAVEIIQLGKRNDLLMAQSRQQVEIEDSLTYAGVHAYWRMFWAWWVVCVHIVCLQLVGGVAWRKPASLTTHARTTQAHGHLAADIFGGSAHEDPRAGRH
jgi:hypothetical protein